jgi:lipopolysaccharide/colanic/teichoic acid biosynthesis glycosyltransferase
MNAAVETRSGAAQSIPASTVGSRWCHSRAKRWLDLACATALLLVSAPIMVVAAALVKASSPGPVLFRHRRSGKCGSQFELLKFRTMVDGAPAIGPGVTRKGDPRVTRVGRWLRKWKLDELPQLINVLRGEVSLVGPRPDLPEYLAELPPSQRRVVHLKPGLTSPATLRFRNEESVLAQVAPEAVLKFYLGTLLPQKITLDLEYAASATFLTDLSLLLRTATAILIPQH